MSNDVFAKYLVRANREQTAVISGCETACEAWQHIRLLKSEGFYNFVVRDRSGQPIELNELERRARLEATDNGR